MLKEWKGNKEIETKENTAVKRFFSYVLHRKIESKKKKKALFSDRKIRETKCNYKNV